MVRACNRRESAFTPEAPAVSSLKAGQAKPTTGVWTVLISVSLSIVLLYLALRGVDWRRVWTVISVARAGYLGLACLMGTVSYFVRSLRWRVLLSAQARLGVLAVFWATMAGYLGNNILPARAGELLRSVMVSSRSGLSKTFVLTTALAERVADAIILVALSSALLLTMRGPGWIPGNVGRILAAAVVGLLILIASPRAGGLLGKALARLPVPERFRSKFAGLAGQVSLGIRTFHHPGRLMAFSAFSAVIWTLDASGAIVTAHALGLSLPVPAALLLLAGLGLGSALPSTPGYVGIYQLVAVTVLAPFGFSRSDALAYILVAQFLTYMVTCLWGLIGVWRYRSLLRPREA